MQSLTNQISNLTLNNQLQNESAIKIQRWFRNIRMNKLHKLPNVMYLAQQIIIDNNITCCDSLEDGRINSCFDEDTVKFLLKRVLKKRAILPKKRKWYDILLYDYKYKWIPVNIKSSTLNNSDNTGNMAMCVHAYTDEVLDLNKNHNSGKMSRLFMEKINSNQFNYNHKKDYYFIVVNKNKTTEVIINSVLGLTYLTPNNNNLPFQVCWEYNKTFNYGNIKSKVKMFMECLKKPAPSWKETFMKAVRSFDIDTIDKPKSTKNKFVENTKPPKVKLNIINFFKPITKTNNIVTTNKVVTTVSVEKETKKKVILRKRNPV
jgi:hypothetical protein